MIMASLGRNSTQALYYR